MPLNKEANPSSSLFIVIDDDYLINLMTEDEILECVDG